MYDEQIKKNEKLILSVIYNFYKVKHPNAINKIIRDLGMEFEDLVQLGRLAYFKALKTYDNKGKFNGWFYTIFKNDLKVLARKQGADMRQGEAISMDVIVADDEDKPLTLEDMLSYDAHIESNTFVKILLQSLNEEERTMLSMELQGYSQRQIGKVVGMSQRLICKKLHKIKDKLRSEFDEC